MRRWIVAIAGLGVGVLLIAPGAAAAKQRVVVKPKPGQQITHHSVRLVVRAGPEVRDLKARLNGKSIGQDFLVPRRGRRELMVSGSHGLQHGRNVLKVVARTHHGTRVRRSKVRFTVAHKRPLAGAGRDLRVVRGSGIKVKGKVVEHPDGPSGDRVRWKVAHAPRRSRLRHHSATKRASGKPPALRSATSVRPTFKPDAIGSYTLKVTVGRGAASTTDRVTLNSVPASPLVEAHTRVTDAKTQRPAIQVGNQTYVAPYLSTQAGTGTYHGAVDGVGFPDYQALYQVVLLSRTTLEFVANLTFGVCRAESGSDAFYKTCVNDQSGKPDILNMGSYLEKQGSDPSRPVLVVANSLPAAIQDPASADFVREEMVKHALDDLDAIGFPSGHDLDDVTQSGSVAIETQLNTAPVDSLSVIGSPSLKPGEADFAVIGEAAARLGRGMNGYLTPDQNVPAHYHFVPAARVPFDTRFGANGDGTDACDGTGCTVTARIGDETLTHKVETGYAAFLVAAYDPHTLEPQDLDYFLTGGRTDFQQANAEPRATAMAAFLKKWGDAGSVILISSVHTPSTPPSHLADTTIHPEVWADLAKQVAAVGGTLNGFNTAAQTADSDYTLLGFGGAGEGGGSESTGEGARLRGVLVPDGQSQYRPENVSDNLGDATDPADGSPSEFLTRLILTPPGTKPWPYADDPGVSAAMAYIFGQVPALAAGRTAYWANDIDAGRQQTLVNAVKLPTDVVTPSGQKPLGDLFTPDEFKTAQGEISDELGYVANVRNYLGHLAAPSGDATKNAWGDAKTLADSLNTTLKALQAQGDRNLQIIDLFVGFLDLASLPFGGEEGEVIEKLVYSASAGLEFASNAMQTAQDGSSPGDEDAERQVDVDHVGSELRDRLQGISDSFDPMGDIIISDWDKLQLVGKYGGCDLNGGGCVCKLKGGCPPGLDQLAYPKSDARTAPALTTIELQRMVHEKVLPYYFPIRDTGLTHSCQHPPPCSPDNGPEPRWDHGDSPSFVPYLCGGVYPQIGSSTPFGVYDPNGTQADEAYAISLERLDPAGGGNKWRVFLAASQVDGLWGWPDEAILHRMFTPVDVDNLGADPPIGLGISPVDWMREANADGPGEPPFGCGWLSAP